VYSLNTLTQAYIDRPLVTTINMTEELTRVDSAIAGLSISPKDEKTQTKAVEKEKKKEKDKKHKRMPSTAEGVRNIKDLGMLSYHVYPIEIRDLTFIQRRNRSPLRLPSKHRNLAGASPPSPPFTISLATH
jgi:hypothetical protein